MIPEPEEKENLVNSNYSVEEDDSFTPDEIEAIKKYKAVLERKLNKNQSIVKGLEVGFWGITSYSISRFLVLTTGSQGIGLAIALSLLINNITNRDCLDSFSLDRKEGEWNINGMGKIIKFGFSTLIASFIIWNATGDLLSMANSSKATYEALGNKVEEFNRLPERQQNTILVIGGIIGLAGIYTIVDTLNQR
jgi:hypothetical protein